MKCEGLPGDPCDHEAGPTKRCDCCEAVTSLAHHVAGTALAYLAAHPDGVFTIHVP